MGIHDRDYIREQRPGGGMMGGGGGVGSIRALSVNTWLIIFCVAIFMIDGFTAQHQINQVPVQLVPGRYLLPEGTTLTPGAEPDLSVAPRMLDDGTLVVPLVDQPTGVEIGLAEVFPLNGVISEYLHFSTQRGFLEFGLWRLIGFQFLHANLMHLLFNMIALYFFGPLIERHLGSKRYLAFYLLCGIFGALFYTLLNLGGFTLQIMAVEGRIPLLLFNSPATPLVGASAGVFGVLMAGAYIAPKATVYLFFVLPMQLRTLAYALVALAIFILITGGRNAGGEAGHLGGAMAGWYFIRNPRHLHGFFDFLGRFDPTSRHYRGPRSGPRRDPASRREIDRILDKINREGLHSLSDAEKRALRDASQRDQ